MSSKPLGGYSVSAHSLVEHVRRRVKRRDLLQAAIARYETPWARAHAEMLLRDIERDLAEIRQLVSDRGREA